MVKENFAAAVLVAMVVGMSADQPAMADTVYVCRGARDPNPENRLSYLRIIQYQWFHPRAAIVSDGFLLAATTVTKADPATVFTYVRANSFDGVITIVPAKPGEADAVLQETGRLVKRTERYRFSCSVTEISTPGDPE
jgi:hypothetical protein